MPHLMQRSTPRFRCGLVSSSLGDQRVGQINPFVVLNKVVVGAEIEEATATSA